MYIIYEYVHMHILFLYMSVKIKNVIYTSIYNWIYMHTCGNIWGYTCICVYIGYVYYTAIYSCI